MVHFDNDPIPDAPRGPRIKDIRDYRASFVGMGALVCVPFLIGGAHAVYGRIGIVVLSLLWLVFFVMGCRWFSEAPRRVLMVAGLSVLCWLAAVLLAR